MSPAPRRSAAPQRSPSSIRAQFAVSLISGRLRSCSCCALPLYAMCVACAADSVPNHALFCWVQHCSRRTADTLLIAQWLLESEWHCVPKPFPNQNPSHSHNLMVPGKATSKSHGPLHGCWSSRTSRNRLRLRHACRLLQRVAADSACVCAYVMIQYHDA